MATSGRIAAPFRAVRGIKPRTGLPPLSRLPSTYAQPPPSLMASSVTRPDTVPMVRLLRFGSSVISTLPSRL